MRLRPSSSRSIAAFHAAALGFTGMLASAAIAATLGACGESGDTPEPDTKQVDTFVAPPDTAPDATPDVPDTAGQICPPNKLFCTSPRESGQCNADGSGIASTTPCVGATACEPSTGLCRATICEPDVTNCLDLKSFQVCASDGSGWGESQDCAEPLFCADGKCRACTENEVECLSETTYRRCAEDASAWSNELLCPADHRCMPDEAALGGADCKRCGFERVCVSDTKVRVRCTSGEIDYQEEIICGAGTTCMDGFCHACEPKKSECLSETTYRECADDGSAWSPETTCPPDKACFEGQDHCLPYSCSPRVLLLVDYSGSMSVHWDNVAASVASLLEQNPDIRFGMKTFPDEDGGFGCTVSGNLEIPFAADQAETFATWFASHDPPGSTPLANALGAVNDNAEALFGPLGGYVIMLSDGEDSCFGDFSTLHQYLALTTAALYVDHKVATYGIAYAQGDQPAGEMDTVAKNGGTGATQAIDAGNETELTAAFNAIIDKVKFCDEAGEPSQ